MAETFDQVAALVPLRALRRIGLERSLVEKKRLPDRQRRADVDGKAEVVGARGLAHRRDRRHQVGIDRVDVGILDLGELVVGERGIEMPAVRPTPSFMERRNASLDHVPMPVSGSGVMLEV
jgi:hypothetical protein